MIFEIEIPSVLYKIYESGWLIYGNDWFVIVLEISIFLLKLDYLHDLMQTNFILYYFFAIYLIL